MNTDLREVLASKGATQTQLNSATLKMCAEAIAEGAIDELGLARSQVNDLMTKVDGVESGLDRRISAASQSVRQLDAAMSRADQKLKEVTAKVGELGELTDSITVSDAALKDAANMFSLILLRTKQILGDDAMTEAVIVQLLETASYGLQRSIMWPKDASTKASNGSQSNRPRYL